MLKIIIQVARVVIFKKTRNSTQYKFAKKYGLIQETEMEVKFYFETLT